MISALSRDAFRQLLANFDTSKAKVQPVVRPRTNNTPDYDYSLRALSFMAGTSPEGHNILDEYLQLYAFSDGRIAMERFTTALVSFFEANGVFTPIMHDFSGKGGAAALYYTLRRREGMKTSLHEFLQDTDEMTPWERKDARTTLKIIDTQLRPGIAEDPVYEASFYNLIMALFLLAKELNFKEQNVRQIDTIYIGIHARVKNATTAEGGVAGESWAAQDTVHVSDERLSEILELEAGNYATNDRL